MTGIYLLKIVQSFYEPKGLSNRERIFIIIVVIKWGNMGAMYIVVSQTLSLYLIVTFVMQIHGIW